MMIRKVVDLPRATVFDAMESIESAIRHHVGIMMNEAGHSDFTRSTPYCRTRHADHEVHAGETGQQKSLRATSQRTVAMKTKTLPKAIMDAKAIMEAKAKLRGALLYAFLRDRKSGAGMNDAPFPLDYANRHAIDILKKAQDADFVIDQLTQGGQSLTQVARSLTRTSPAITTCDQRSVVWLDGQAYAEFEMAGTNLKCFLKKPAEYRVALAVFQEADARNCDVVTADNGGDIYNRIGRIVRTLNGAVILSKDVDVTTDRLLTLFPSDHFASITSNSRITIRQPDGVVRCRPFTDALWTDRQIVADALSLTDVDIAITDFSVRSLRLSHTTLRVRQFPPQKLSAYQSSICCTGSLPAIKSAWALNECVFQQDNLEKSAASRPISPAPMS